MNLLELLAKKTTEMYWSIQAVTSKGVQICYILETEDIKTGDHGVYSFNESDQTFMAEGGMGGFGDDDLAIDIYQEAFEMIIRTITGLKEFKTEVICTNDT